MKQGEFCYFKTMKLPRSFFKQKTLKVARELLGCFLIRQTARPQCCAKRSGRGNKKIIARIIETEAYCGEKDLASHASQGRTKRTEVMFGPAGHAYIYLIYGMYYCFNIVTEKVDYPAAVLIRGVEINNQKIIGPGRVCRELKINKELNGVDLIKSNKLYITNRVGDDSRLPSRLRSKFGGQVNRRYPRIKKLPRVGVDYAREYKDKLWRFVLE